MSRYAVRPCDICEAPYKGSYRGQRTCSRTCGAILQHGYPKSVVEWRHCEPCGMWHTKHAQAQHLHPKQAIAKDMSWMTLVRECPTCGTSFTNAFTTIIVNCSSKCSRKAAKQRRRVRESGSYGEWRWSDFMRMARRFAYCCAYCGVKPERLDPDHVVPLSRGGPNVLANLLPTCPACNSDKGSNTLAEWAAHRVQHGKPERTTEWSPTDPRYWHLTAIALSVEA